MKSEMDNFLWFGSRVREYAIGRSSGILDGDCAFCGRAIAWFQRNDRQHCFQFIQVPGRPVSADDSGTLSSMREAIHVIDREGSIPSSGRAMLLFLSTKAGDQSRDSIPSAAYLVLLSSYIGSSPRTGPGLVDSSFAGCLDSAVARAE